MRQPSSRYLSPLLSLALTLGFLWIGTSQAEAASRTVCFRLQFPDNRTECAVGSDTGRRRACNPGGFSDARGHIVELWDWDQANNGANDDYIGTYTIKDVGRQCINFEWEGKPYAGNEGQPDPYLRYVFRSANTQAGTRHQATIRIGSSAPVQPMSRDDRLMTCRPGTTCELGNLLVTDIRGSQTAKLAMLVDSAQHALHIVGRHLLEDIVIQYVSSLQGAITDDRRTIRIGSERATRGSTITHEIGHALMMQLFNRDGLCFSYLKFNQDGHNFDSVEFDSAAFVEGWAEYIRFVSWWNPSNRNSRPRIKNPNVPIEEANCMFPAPNPGAVDRNRGNEIQVAKALWDLDDANNEVAGISPALTPDTIDLGTDAIIQGLTRFSEGTANGQACEAGPEGPNLKDYYRNNAGTYGLQSADAYNALFFHNCLNGQEN